AETVLMPGDPLRAQFIAENYLTDVYRFTTVRNMYGFTGTYNKKRVSVMGHGMGMPSIGLYTHELYNFYGVENIIRVGSAGGISDNVHLRDIIIAQGASTDSAYANQYKLPGTFAPLADFGLLEKAVCTARAKGLTVRVGNVISTDVFYNDDPHYNDAWKKMGVLAVEMEAAALYLNAARSKKKALCILTVSDHLYSPEQLTVEERQTGFGDMISIALELI
ncbi:MAG TPA: purine-nucleoside phosphorylase, partial [Bacillota bacterium]|nr:purine-nucleoside phosphorylase [Bacillota bacterium]